MRSTKRTVYEHTERVVDLRSGEVITHTQTNVSRLPNEPPFVKMYLDDLCAIVDAPKALKDTLLVLLRKLDYEGYMALTPRSRQAIADRLNITEKTFRNRLLDLCSKGLIKRVSTNEYMANPMYFARGDWKSVCEQRKTFAMTVTYSEARGRVVETGVVEEQGELPL